MAINFQGWTPYDERGVDGRYFTDEFHAGLQSFEDLSWDYQGDDPDFVNCFALTKKANGGKLPPFCWQTTGSCVGAGSYHAQLVAQAGDIILRGDSEQFKLPFWLYSYGIGRKGMRGRGSGSYGAVQAKATKEYGLLPMGHGDTPQPSLKSGWIKYSSNTELEWSYSPRFPISLKDLEGESKKHQIQDVIKVKSTDDLHKLLRSGYGCTIAGRFGISGKPRVMGDPGVLLGSWTGSWAHQMSYMASFNHPGLGRLFWVQNQWGPRAHGKCPFMAEFDDYASQGGFWVDDKTAQKMISKGECYAHSDTEGFGPRSFVWSHGIV
jgi:hypothetical protein